MAWILQSNLRYFKKETAVTTKEFPTGELTNEYDILFVDLIICPEYFAAYKKEKLQYYGIEREKYRNNGHFYPTINQPDKGPREIFYEVSYEVDEILNGIRIETLDKKSPYIDIDFSKTNFDQHITITSKFKDTFGRCYSIIPKQGIQNLGVVGILFEAKMDIYVYFSHPGQFLNPNGQQKVKTIFLKTLVNN